MAQITATMTGFQSLPPRFVRAGDLIQFPPGTIMSEDRSTWALYVNPGLRRSWIGYATPAGTRIVPMGGVKSVGIDMGKIDAFVKQRQAAGCGGCGG